MILFELEIEAGLTVSGHGRPRDQATGETARGT
jgi:hypothetical protein